jgi:ketosteroid isomerase-like protein
MKSRSSFAQQERESIMPATTPEQAHELFVEYFNAADIDALVSLYEPNAMLVPFSGVSVSGHAAIREALGGFLGPKGRMELKVDRIFRADDVALIFSSWSLKGTGPDGKPLQRTGQTSDVVRRQADDTWRFVIDNPRGAAARRDNNVRVGRFRTVSAAS